MKIVVDDKIPYIRETLEQLADEVVYKKGLEIGPEDVKDVDALIVRTRTRCDEQLLKGSKVQFVATATIGYDHIDTTWCEQNGIEWTNSPGCNSGSVAQYIESVLLSLNPSEGGGLVGLTLGVVGCGHVGSKVCRVGEQLGMRVLVNDPPLASQNPAERRDLPTDSILPLPLERVGVRLFVSLETIAREADIITFHVPLDETTRYLADEAFFKKLRRQPNRAIKAGKLSLYFPLFRFGDNNISHSDIHIKRNTYILYPTDNLCADTVILPLRGDFFKALCRHFSLPQPPPIQAPKLPKDFQYTGNPLELYNAMNDSRKLKSCPESFEDMRGNYPLRREFFDQ